MRHAPLDNLRAFGNAIAVGERAEAMEFVNGRPDLVRAINQRWLLKQWDILRNGRALPDWQNVDTNELAGISANLSYMEVVRNGGQPRFLIAYHGTQMAEVYGSQCAGKFLDDVLPPALRDGALAIYRYLIEAKRPLYTIADIRDGNGSVVHFERLLLPFGRDDTAVDRIIVSHEMVSHDGAFEVRNLMRSQTAAPAYTCCAAIHH
jgi:hypothetical protein